MALKFAPSPGARLRLELTSHDNPQNTEKVVPRSSITLSGTFFPVTFSKIFRAPSVIFSFTLRDFAGSTLPTGCRHQSPHLSLLGFSTLWSAWCLEVESLVERADTEGWRGRWTYHHRTSSREHRDLSMRTLIRLVVTGGKSVVSTLVKVILLLTGGLTLVVHIDKRRVEFERLCSSRWQ